MMNTKKIFWSLSIVILLAIILLTFKYVLYKPQTSSEQEVSVRMKWFFSGTMSGWFAAQEHGFYKEKGIKIEINSGGPDNSSIKLVAAGSDMFGVAGADEVIIAREKGIPVVPIAVLFKESPIGFISKVELGIKSPLDWSNKTVEVDYGSNAEIQFRALVKKFNVQNIKEQPYSFSMVPFIEGKVDISVAYIMDQVVTLREQNINVNVITAKEYGINPYGDVIITTEKTLKENPALVKKFIDATIKSHQWAIENKSLAVDALVKYAPSLKKEKELLIWDATIPFLLSNEGIEKVGKMNDYRWTETQDILLKAGAIKNAQKINF